MEFLTIFGKVVAKNKVFENNTIFYNNFSPISGGAERSPPPLSGACYVNIIDTNLSLLSDAGEVSRKFCKKAERNEIFIQIFISFDLKQIFAKITNNTKHYNLGGLAEMFHFPLYTYFSGFGYLLSFSPCMAPLLMYKREKRCRN